MLKKIVVILLIFIAPQAFCTSKEEIKGQINNILAKLPSSSKTAIIIYNPLTRDTVFSQNAKVSMIPASNTKLFTTATALTILGGDFKLKTKLLTEDKNIKDGVINGNIYIKGFGNSEFTSSDLDSLVQFIKNIGVNSVTGNVIGDDTYFDDIYTRDDWIKDEVANVRLPAISALVIDRNRKYVTKRYRRRLRHYTINISDPALFAAEMLKEKLQKYGISAGHAMKGEAPKHTNSLAETNISLRRLIQITDKHSDNFLAECLFKTIGAEASGIQGNSFYSTQAILDFIDDNGIFSNGTSIVDGSGISRFDQVTVGSIAGLLEKMYFDVNNYDDFYNALSIAGVDGTLRHRLRGTAAENNFHGKTGSLNGVSSLSGYLTTSKGEDLVVSIIMEFDRGGWNYYRRIQDDIIQTLAEWN